MSGIIGSVGARSGIVGSDVYPAGHVIQIKDAWYTGSQITTSTTETTQTFIEISNFTAHGGTSNKIIVNFFCSGTYTTTASAGTHIGFRYSTDNFSSEAVLGRSTAWAAAYVNYHNTAPSKASISVSTGLIDCPTALEFDIRIRTKTNAGSTKLNQDGSNLDTTGLIIYEVQQ
jgi:hypothetical protein